MICYSIAISGSYKPIQASIRTFHSQISTSFDFWTFMFRGGHFLVVLRKGCVRMSFTRAHKLSTASELRSLRSLELHLPVTSNPSCSSLQHSARMSIQPITQFTVCLLVQDIAQISLLHAAETWMLTIGQLKKVPDLLCAI